jgi:hypothetical protein
MKNGSVKCGLDVDDWITAKKPIEQSKSAADKREQPKSG